MVKRKSKSTVPEHTHLTIKIESYDASIDAAINYEVRNPRHYHDEARVHSFTSRLAIKGICTYPEVRQDDEYSISISGSDRHLRQFDLTLRDCIARDDYGRLKYRKVRGVEIPVYDIPKDIGMLDRQRGTNYWTGWVWVPPRTVTDMLTLLPHVRPLFLAIHEIRERRYRGICALTLQTDDPAGE